VKDENGCPPRARREPAARPDLHPSSFILAKQPLFGQPKQDYYGAHGPAVRVRWELESKAVHAGADLNVALVVTGAQNPTEIVKPDLRKLRAFDAFQVTNAPDPPRDAGAKEVRFAYKLAPRSTAVTEIPELKFHYYNARAAEGRQFPATRAAAVEITVAEPPKAVRPVVPIEAPEHLFRVPTGPGVLGPRPFVPSVWAWLAAALVGPVAALGWFLAWRQLFPDAARLARLRRSRAARRALDLIRKAHRAPEPPAAIANAVLGYLRARFPLPESAVTPSEITAALRELGVPAGDAEQVGAVFRACDEARFAPASNNGASLTARAETAVAKLEALA
jgi:hypothetical protein